MNFEFKITSTGQGSSNPTAVIFSLDRLKMLPLATVLHTSASFIPREKDPDSYRLLNSRGTWSFKGIINLNGESVMWGQLAASPAPTPHPERYSWNWKGQQCPNRAKGCREGKECYLKSLIFGSIGTRMSFYPTLTNTKKSVHLSF